MGNSDYQLHEAKRHDLQIVTHTSTGRKAILRKRKKILSLANLKKESEFMGFGYRIRTLPEVAIFMGGLREIGVGVPEVLEFSDDYIVEELIEGKQLRFFLPQDSGFSLGNRYLDLILSIHAKGIVVGDRWGKNELVTDAGKLVLIDFDQEYVCNFDRELEIAEVVNGLAMFSENPKVSLLLRDFLLNDERMKPYDRDKVMWILQKHVEFWGDQRKYLSLVIDGENGS